jgi:hypothetical protein
LSSHNTLETPRESCMRLRENGLSADDSACCLVSCTQVLPPPVSFLLSLIASRRDDQTLARAWVLYYTTSAVVVVVAAGSFTHTLIFSLSLDFHFFVCVCRSYTYENGVTQFGGWPPPVSFFSQPRQPGVVRFSFCFFFVSVGIKMRCRQHNLVSTCRCYRYPLLAGRVGWPVP